MTPEEMRRAIIANPPAKSGHSHEERMPNLAAKGPDTSKECIAWLQASYDEDA